MLSTLNKIIYTGPNNNKIRDLAYDTDLAQRYTVAAMYIAMFNDSILGVGICMLAFMSSSRVGDDLFYHYTKGPHISLGSIKSFRLS
jgi:hypothetical protein